MIAIDSEVPGGTRPALGPVTRQTDVEARD